VKIRFLTSSISVFILFSAAVLWWTPERVEGLLRDEALRRGRLVAEVMDKSAIGALIVSDQTALSQLAKGLIRSPEVLYVLFLDKDGRPLADSGLSKEDYASVEKQIPRALAQDIDWTGDTGLWYSSGEPFVHLSRPVFYEQLRIGTVMVGVSTRWGELAASQLREQWALICGVLAIGVVLVPLFFARSVSRRLKMIAEGLDNPKPSYLESAAGGIPELKLLVENLQKSRNLYSSTLKEIEEQKIQMEVDLARVQEENSALNLRLGSALKQVTALQEKLKAEESQLKDLGRLFPVVQFATEIVADVESSMKHISQGAKQLQEDLSSLSRLIRLYEKAATQSPSDLEALSRFKDSINSEKIKESLEELLATIRGGANWTEQLVEILKQLPAGGSEKKK
jgi:hypothetical protein